MSCKYRAVVIGVSAGGMATLSELFPKIPSNFPIPIFVVQHIHKSQSEYLITYYNGLSNLTIKEAKDKEKAVPGNIYFAPPDYHMLLEEDETFSISIDEKVNYSRPSIDVLFESAADVYKNALVGIILTGANNDGTEGIRIIKQNGGYTIAQEPEEAEFLVMPKSAIDTGKIDKVLTLSEISDFINYLLKNTKQLKRRISWKE